jgi:acetyltransferase-like isoleucine patch superfamily enzyme
MKVLFRNPITIWLQWLLVKIYYEYKYSSNNLKIGFLAYVSGCQFGRYNTLYQNTRLTNVSLGDFSYISENSRISNTTIGKYCSIGFDVIVGTGRHPSRIFVSTHPIFFSPLCQAQRTFTSEAFFDEFIDISIGHDVWIGAKSIIIDGVTIGNGAIVGAGAVVTNNVPPYAIVGGVPAKIIRYRFSQEEIDFLEEFKWWDREFEWLKENFDKFHDINELRRNL